MKKLFILTSVILAVACCSKAKTNVDLLPQASFDTVLNGKAVTLYTLENKDGMAVQITNYGARMVAVWVKSKDGSFKDVVWGYSSIKDYLNATDGNAGPIVGRYGNRIGDGKFTLDSVAYQLDINNGKNHLHGGKLGFSTKVWDAVQGETADGEQYVTLSYLSPDGEQGYPANVTINVKYTLKKDNSIEIAYDATTDAPTIVNPTSHAYFNLHGTSAESTNSHLLTIYAEQFTPTDSTLIPTGEILSVEGTPLDFRKSTAIGDRINSDYQPIVFGKGYDHNWVLVKSAPATMSVAADVYEPATGILMTVSTDQPGLQFYSGNFMDGVDVGKRGDLHNYRSGIALETQNFPDAPNHANFPSAVLRPGETYKHIAVYKFDVK